MVNEIRDRALALILKARLPKDAEKILALLEEERRGCVEALMAAAPADADAELRRLRGEELATLERAQVARYGAAWKELSPALRFWAWHV